MAIEISKSLNVKDRALQLECNAPTRLTLLPQNFDSANSKDELIYTDTVTSIRSLWRQAGLIETRIEKEKESIPYEQLKSFDLVLPTIFIGFSFLTQDPNLVSVALNVISTYLTDFFKGIPGKHEVELDVLVEKNKEGECFKISYKGSEKGLADLPSVIEEARKKYE